MPDNIAYCENLVRAGDKDRWLASLFAPADPRAHLHALYAFNLEVARVRDHLTIGANAMVGMGAAVVKDVAASVTVVGVPAKVLKS